MALETFAVGLVSEYERLSAHLAPITVSGRSENRHVEKCAETIERRQHP